jgi:hypothetical protein
VIASRLAVLVLAVACAPAVAQTAPGEAAVYAASVSVQAARDAQDTRELADKLRGPMECTRDAMTDAETCTASEWVPGGGYSIRVERGLMVLVVTRNAPSHVRATSVMVRLDGAKAIHLAAPIAGGTPSCRNYPCTWSNYAGALPTRAQFAAITSAATVLAAPAAGNFATDPVVVDPARVRAWLADLAARGYTPPE